MYEHLSVENFRGLRTLSAGDLGRVNLFVGPNNAGKTSLLEAAWFLQNPGNPTLPIVLAGFRGVNVPIQSPNTTWPDLFYDQDPLARIEMRGTSVDGTNEQLAITLEND